MAKKAKKEKSVVVTPDEAAAVTENVSDEAEELKPSKKKKKKNKRKDENSEENENLETEVMSPMKKIKTEDKLNSESISDEKVIEKKGGSVVRSAKERMKTDFSYITSFLGAIHIPRHKTNDEDILDACDDDEETLEEKQKRVRPGDTSRANNREELQERLQAKLEELRGQKSDGQNSKKAERKLKKKLAKIEKKKKESEELKQKLMTVGRNAGKKGNLMKAAESLGAVPKKPGVKTSKGVVFSKFDFKDEIKSSKDPKKNLDPQAALNKLKKNKEKIKMWEDKGRSDKASKIENNIAWDNALKKAQGEKVKDDVTLLKKSIKKQKQIKSSSKKKWEKRADEVKSKESAFVEKRETNLNKRIKEKKDKTMKKLAAKGRHVPGF